MSLVARCSDEILASYGKGYPTLYPVLALISAACILKLSLSLNLDCLSELGPQMAFVRRRCIQVVSHSRRDAPRVSGYKSKSLSAHVSGGPEDFA